jgi:hypothetical protein
MFCFVENNKILSGIVTTDYGTELIKEKKRIFNTLPVERDCRPGNNLLSSIHCKCLGPPQDCLPCQKHFCKSSKLPSTTQTFQKISMNNQDIVMESKNFGRESNQASSG